MQHLTLRYLTWALLALAVWPEQAASAAPVYPWCAHYMMKGGPHNCGFTSFEQCLDNVRGIGGFCDRNPYYTVPAAPLARQKRSG